MTMNFRSIEGKIGTSRGHHTHVVQSVACMVKIKVPVYKVWTVRGYTVDSLIRPTV